MDAIIDENASTDLLRGPLLTLVMATHVDAEVRSPPLAQSVLALTPFHSVHLDSQTCLIQPGPLGFIC